MLPTAWQKHYEWNFDWTTDWVQSGGEACTICSNDWAVSPLAGASPTHHDTNRQEVGFQHKLQPEKSTFENAAACF